MTDKTAGVQSNNMLDRRQRLIGFCSIKIATIKKGIEKIVFATIRQIVKK